jgi:hypothetical protein
MDGASFYAYVLRTFKRTDKETESYEAITDAVMTISREFDFQEIQDETVTTDTITSLGDYKLSLESDTGFLVSDVIIRDGDSSRPLELITKDRFDALYPNPASATVNKAKPIHACIFANQIYLGPVPDDTDYQYYVSQATKLTAAITSGTASVPFSGFDMRECLKLFTLQKMYGVLENQELEAMNGMKAESMLKKIIAKEMKLRRPVILTQYQGF